MPGGGGGADNDKAGGYLVEGLMLLGICFLLSTAGLLFQ